MPAILNNTALPCTKYVTASQDGLPQSLRNTYKGNFQPRVSVAYRPFNDTKTVMRAGFGIYTMTNLGPLSFNNSGNPTSNLHTYPNCDDGRSGYAADPVSEHGASNGRCAVWRRRSGSGSGSELPRSAVEPVERDGGAADHQQRQFARELCGDAHLPAEHYGGPEPDSREHNALSDNTLASPYVDPRAPYHNWFSLYSTFNAGKANYAASKWKATHRACARAVLRCELHAGEEPGGQPGRCAERVCG